MDTDLYLLHELSLRQLEQSGSRLSPPRGISKSARRQYLHALAPVYQAAFRGEPWYERTKCPPRCPRTYCSHPPGMYCDVSGERPTEEAYPEAEVVEGFERILDSGGVVFAELIRDNATPGVAQLGAAALETDATEVGDRRYDDVPAMRQWLVERFGSQRFVWRDEVFADTVRRPRGNLQRYADMCVIAARMLRNPLTVGRTINPAVLHTLVSRFEGRCTLFAPRTGRVRHGTELPQEIWRNADRVLPDDRFLVAVDMPLGSG